MLATWAVTGEVLHSRLRKGSSQRGAKRFVEELIARDRRAGAIGPLVVRCDSGSWSYALIDTLTRLGVAWSITVAISPRIRAAIEAIAESAWEWIVYPDGGRAQVAETTYVAGSRVDRRSLRLVVRRTQLTDPTQLALWPDWRRHAFLTDLDLPTVAVDRFHRDHATVELATRDLKEGAGLEHCPSGRCFANAAWLGCAVLAHNLNTLDGPPRPSPSPRPAHRGPHRPLTDPRPARPAREPKRSARPAPPRPMAVGRGLHQCPRTHPCPATTCLNAPWRSARPQTRPRADN